MQFLLSCFIVMRIKPYLKYLIVAVLCVTFVLVFLAFVSHGTADKGTVSSHHAAAPAASSASASSVAVPSSEPDYVMSAKEKSELNRIKAFKKTKKYINEAYR